MIHTQLADGDPVCIRAIRPSDEAMMRAGIAGMSDRSRYLRFFSGARTPPDWVIERLLHADGDRHLAWGAIDTRAMHGAEGAGERETTQAIGAVHAFRDQEHPDCAEFSVAIIDKWHGRGLGKLLTATILLDAEAEGIARFHVDTLAENRTAIEFVRGLGGAAAGHDGLTQSYLLDVGEALRRLRADCEPPGIAAVFAAFAA